MSEVRDHLRSAFEVACERAVSYFKEEFTSAILIDEFSDEGVAEPGKEKGAGFAIFIGEWRIGWWKTREEACDVAGRFEGAIFQHPVKKAPEAI